MAITRTLSDIRLRITPASGDVTVVVSGVISDSVEDTSTDRQRIMLAPAVVNAAVALRDAVLTVAAAAGKPMTF